MRTKHNVSQPACDKKMIDAIKKVAESHILHLARNDPDRHKVDEIFASLEIMLNGSYEKYKFNEDISDRMMGDGLSEHEIQETLSKLNEKQESRRSNGVYYTPKDVVSFIVDNCFNKLVNSDAVVVPRLEVQAAPRRAALCGCSVFDPTCGTGEFLLGALKKKLALAMEEEGGVDDQKLAFLLSTVYGNDINAESIEIAKLRLFFETIKYTRDAQSYRRFAKIINSNMSCADFINIDTLSLGKRDIIIGNPPYVEDTKAAVKPFVAYGNVYANILQNSVDMLSAGGVMGFIVPISYTSTPRMKRIRRYIERAAKWQCVLNYADRPDCLFPSVHQKLSIIFAVEGKDDCVLHTAGYRYWYKSERAELFARTATVENEYRCEDFYPKLGNPLEKSIFGKVFTAAEESFLSKTLPQEPNLFLNMRGCFWIKAFSFNPGSKEYKGFGFEEGFRDFILCLLNSSLFFLYWNTVSDCWHITSKELKHLRVPDVTGNTESFIRLAKELENKLEDTKKYIGTKQTEYEYKHRLCKDVIDRIDDSLAEVYNLTENELDYIKSYSVKYRESLGGIE